MCKVWRTLQVLIRKAQLRIKALGKLHFQCHTKWPLIMNSEELFHILALMCLSWIFTLQNPSFCFILIMSLGFYWEFLQYKILVNRRMRKVLEGLHVLQLFRRRVIFFNIWKNSCASSSQGKCGVVNSISTRLWRVFQNCEQEFLPSEVTSQDIIMRK